MSLPDLPFATIIELGAAYRSKKLSPVEVTQAMLERIASLQPRLHAFVTVTPEIVLAQARKSEAAFARGEFKSPMQGVPVGIKDLCETAGVRTTWGTKILRDYVPESDCTVVSRLFADGAVMLGKLQMTEGAYSVHHPEVTPPVNPWHPGHWPGVSSSGSGVAPAAGLCYGAIGTDTGGSIRFPSGANAITGLKPTWGRVSRHGVQALADSLDHLGPMTRCAADTGAMFMSMAGADPEDPTSLEAPVPDCLTGIGQGIAGLRVGFDPRFVYEVSEADTGKIIDEARRTLASLGAKVAEVAMPRLTERMYKDWTKFCAVETAVAHERWYPARKAEYGPVLADLIEQGHSLGALDGFQLVSRHLEEALLIRASHAFQQATDFHTRHPAL
jgi:amidase